MKNILLIIDPQNDFITGTLSVQGAKEKMAKLAAYIDEVGHEYDGICVTMDTHPIDHCSFTTMDGQWPVHCVKETNGWRIPEVLSEVLKPRRVGFYFKGTNPDFEEYSIFDNPDDGELLATFIKTLQNDDDEVYIDVCGIAGDYCVLETLIGLRDLISDDRISVLTEFTASIDGGDALDNFLQLNNIAAIQDASTHLKEYVY
jgi:nicotinamidase/pyrazinamidase